MATRSPVRTPRLVRVFAAWQVSRCRSAYVRQRWSPGSPSQMIAALLPRPSSRCRSRQLYATLSWPPTYHLANGGFDQSSTWSHSFAQVSRRACCAQKPSGSAAASSYEDAVTLAFAASSSGGGNCRVSEYRFSNVSLIRTAPSPCGVTRVSVGNISWGGRTRRGLWKLALMDPLAALLDLADVAAALDAAREWVDSALRHRALRRHGGRIAAEASLRGAVASAALEGHRYDLEDVRGGTVTDPVLQGALRVGEGMGPLVDLWPRAPRQVLARLHVLAARGFVPAAELGRPASNIDRIDALAGLVAGNESTPPLPLAAIVHAELVTLRPFAGPAGIVA